MKQFVVQYSYATFYEAVVKAKTKWEAIEKVKDVIGDDIKIDSACEVKTEKK